MVKIMGGYAAEEARSNLIESEEERMKLVEWQEREAERESQELAL